MIHTLNSTDKHIKATNYSTEVSDCTLKTGKESMPFIANPAQDPSVKGVCISI